MVWTKQKQKILRGGGKNTQKRYTKKIFTTQITVIHTVKDIGIVNKAEVDVFLEL